MTTKNCIKCGECKTLDGFPIDKKMIGGRAGGCKACRKSYASSYRAKNADIIREKDRKRGHGMTTAKGRDYRKRNPEKYKAHNAANNAIRDGKMENRDHCEGPGCTFTGRLDKHHADYSKPLDVEWLCPACHHSGNYK